MPNKRNNQRNQKSKPKQKPKQNSGDRQVSRVVSQPAAKTRIYINPPAPQMKAPLKKNVGVTVSHSEFVGNAVSSIAFAATRFYLNPGRPITFPWLSGLANSFESYRWRSLSIEYRPAVGTTQSGKVILAVDYDASDLDTPTSKMQLLQMQCEMDGPPWEPFHLRCLKSELNKLPQRYVQAYQNPLTEAQRNLFDTGIFWLATEGNAADGTVLGEVWLHYSIDLLTPQPYDGSQLSEKFVPTTPSIVAPFGTGAGTYYGPILLQRNTNTSGYFAATGDFMLEVTVVGTGLTTWSIAASTGIVSIMDQSVNAAGTAIVMVLRARVVTGNTFSWNAAGATVTSMSYRMAPYDYDHN